MARITWDGRALEIEDGANLLMGALEADIFVPHLCFHPALTTPALCRLCAIEVRDDDGGWRLTTACDAQVHDSMEVRTESEAVSQARAAALEFQLVRHPLECPSCDKSGECELQEFSFAYGGEGPYMLPEKGVSEIRDLGDHVAIDPNKCIHCTRCVRFCAEVTGTEELSMFDRGDRLEVATFPGSKMDNRLSGNTVDLCPAGALIDKRFRLQPAWRLRGVDSICTGCSSGCNIRIDVAGDQVQRLKPRVNMDVNEYWMCDDGRHGWHYVHSSERLTHPLIQPAADGVADVAASWDDACEAIHLAFTATRSQGQQIGVILGGQMTNEEAHLLIRLAQGWDSEWISLRKSATEEDTIYPSGFTIRGDRAANSHGIEGVAAELGQSLLGMDQMVEALHEGLIGAAFVVGGGPGVRPDDIELGALSAVADNLVVLDILQDELAALARVVLPGCSFAEKAGTMTNADGHLQRLGKAIEPAPGCLDDIEILKRLAVRFEVLSSVVGEAEAVLDQGIVQAYGGGWSTALQRRGFLAVDDHNKRDRLSRQQPTDTD
jgi:NADH-quinone oxidoreductase subunit G